ncbi:MAG: PP2C family protein-serine/threonine phosphatase, partial [Catenulispora sp.]
MADLPNIEYASLTDVGVRRSHNQDALAVAPAADAQLFREQGHIFLVADGMGGHAVGEKASAKAVRDIPHTYRKHAHEGPAQALRKAFVEANAGINAVGMSNPEFKGMGTTATALLLRPEGAWLGHVGDSRLYRVRNGRIDQLSFDHSYVWELARRQGVRPEDLEGIRTNVIVRSLGPDALVQVDVEGPHPTRPGDIFVLCSDGLSGPVGDGEIGAVATALPPEEACRFLVDLANLRGGPDNISVMVVRVTGDPSGEPERRPALADRLRQVPWPVHLLGSGTLLVLAAIGLNAAELPGGVAVFVLAAAAIGVGLVGLGMHTRRERARAAEAGEPERINIYRQTECRIERGLLERWAKAEFILRQRVRDQGWEADWPAYQAHREEADRRLRDGDLSGA